MLLHLLHYSLFGYVLFYLISLEKRLNFLVHYLRVKN